MSMLNVNMLTWEQFSEKEKYQTIKKTAGKRKKRN